MSKRKKKQKHVTWDQVYWYLVSCPLRKLSGDPLLIKNKRINYIKEALHEKIVKIYYDDINPDDIYDYVRENNKRQPFNYKSSLLQTINDVLVNVTVLRENHRRGTTKLLSEQQETMVYGNMQGHYDLVRKKTNGHLQLGYFMFLPEYPVAQKLVAFYYHASFMGRLYELSTGTRPDFIYYFFPLLGDELTIAYNEQNNLEVVAELITRKVLFTRVTPVCNQCNQCPAVWMDTL